MRRRSILIVLVCLLLLGGGSLFWLANLKLPDFGDLDDRIVTESTKIYDRTGEVLLYNAGGEVRRRVIPGEEISRHLKNATVAIEDDEFYKHHGVKISAIFRAFWVNLVSGSAKQGGSTITQQLIKNSLLTQEKKITRKIKEFFLALRLEKTMEKDDILGWYLNEAPYGGLIYGAEEAAQTFFGVSARDLNLSQAAYLAAIPQAPTYYSPYGSHQEELVARKNLVLQRMLALGFVDQSEYSAAKDAEVEFAPPSEFGIRAPHFTIWVLGELERKYGERAVRNEGFTVITTLDWEKQQAAEETIAQYAESNAENFNANNAGLVALDPKTGQVLAMVGSRDYFDQENEGNFNVTLAHRQPGSAFKPFVYATAFNKGFTAETMLFDLPTQFDTTCASNPSRCYAPSNYDNRFRGPISLRNALAQSVNIPSVKTLYLAGLSDSLQTAERMGITSLGDPNRYGLTLVLGGGEVSLLELTSAYGVFANDGIRHPYENILVVKNNLGEVVEEYTNREQRVLPANTARLISDILSDEAARAPIFGNNPFANFKGRPVALKTGTTNDYRDAWIVGYTPDLVTGAWAGNNDNSPMEKKIAGLIVTPFWRDFFGKAIVGEKSINFIPPEPVSSLLPPIYRGSWAGNINYFVDKISGKLATEATPSNLKEERVIKQIHSILYWLGRQNDPQFQPWETPVRNWASGRIIEETEEIIPKELDDIHGDQYAPQVSLEIQPDRSLYNPSDKIQININPTSSRFPVERADLFLDNHFLGSIERAPFEFFFVPQDLPAPPWEQATLKVIVYDAVGNQGGAEQEIRFRD